MLQRTTSETLIKAGKLILADAPPGYTSTVHEEQAQAEEDAAQYPQSMDSTATASNSPRAYYSDSITPRMNVQVNPVFGKKTSLREVSGQLIVVKGRVRVTHEDIVKATQQKHVEAKQLRSQLQKEQESCAALTARNQKLENDLQVLKMMMQLEVKRKERVLALVQSVGENLSRLDSSNSDALGELKTEILALQKEKDVLESEHSQLKMWTKSYDNREKGSRVKV